MKEFEEYFYQDSYMRTFETTVVSSEPCEKGYAVILENTAFYPEGGGQPFDTGTLNEKKVTEVKRVNGQVVHYLSEPLPKGTAVIGRIDWKRRYDHMVQHTAEHIVSGLIHQKYGYENIGFHMGEETTLIDFDGPLTAEEIKEIECLSNEVIYENREIQVQYPTKEALKNLSYRSKKEIDGQVRLVIIPDCDCCACCGTHVKSTVECGLIKVWSGSVKGRGVRLEISAGSRAFKALCKIYEENTKISHLLSAKPFSTSDAVQRLMEENGKEKAEINAVLRKYIALRIQESTNSESCVFKEEGLDATNMKEMAKGMIDSHKTSTCVVLNKQAEGYNYIAMSTSLDLRALAKKWNSELQGRGGGKPDMVQGHFCAEEKEIVRVLQETFPMVEFYLR